MIPTPSSPASLWTSLEIAKLAASVATPVALGWFGWWLNRNIKRLEQSQWRERALIERRFKLFDLIATDLNDILCFCAFFGDWKKISPVEIIEAKRRLDKIVNVNLALLSSDFKKSYDAFMESCFDVNTGHGETAKIRADISNAWGDRSRHSTFHWKEAEHPKMFSLRPASRKEIIEGYNLVMSEYSKLILLT